MLKITTTKNICVYYEHLIYLHKLIKKLMLKEDNKKSQFLQISVSIVVNKGDHVFSLYSISYFVFCKA